MTEAIVLSVVTITYNDPAGLAETLDSLVPLLGAGVAWEHVIVDGSPASTAPALADLPAEWPLVHVVALPRGIYAAMNAGVRRARGRYVWFLNGKDRLHSAPALLRLLGALAADPRLQLMAGVVERVRHGRPEYRWPPGHDLYARNVGASGVSQQALLYRRDCFQQIGLFDESYRLSGDYEHLLRCWLGGITAATSAAGPPKPMVPSTRK